MKAKQILISSLLILSLFGCEDNATQKGMQGNTTTTIPASKTDEVQAQLQSASPIQPSNDNQVAPLPTATNSSPNLNSNAVANVTTQPVQQYPFIGSKEFNFMGGNGTGMSIKIAADGNTKITACGETGCSTLYKGQFKPIMPIGDGQYVKITKGKAYLLNAAMKVEVDCMGDGKPCVSQLY